jgi:tripartite ATP-independent transporter DctM subunit
MTALLRVSKAVDQTLSALGKGLSWLSLVMVVIGAGNAVLRYLSRFVGLNLASNAAIELQWYLFSAIFLLGAAWTLQQNAHVRVDVLYGRLSKRTQAGIDVAGTLLFLLPFCCLAVWVCFPSVRSSWHVWEASPDPGGLPRWPIKSLILGCFYLMIAQGIATGIQRVAVLTGHTKEPGGVSVLPAVGMLGVMVAAAGLLGFTDWVPVELLGPLLFVAALALIFSGYPVALALGGAAMLFAWIGVLRWQFDWTLMLALPDRIFGIMGNQVLLAVPFFIFMGTMLERSKLAEDLLKTIGQLFGGMRGGLALAVVLVGALLAAATGVVGASVVAMGMISLPIMLRYGYKPELAAGTITASGTLGQIIPPSVVLVVLADQMHVPVGDLFMGSVIPGAMLAGLFAVFVLVVAWIKPEWAPALPESERQFEPGELGRRIVRVMLPPLFLILVVLGSIFAGVATPTEAGALGAVGAMVLAWANGRLTRDALVGTLRKSTELTAMVVFLLIGSTAFALVFRGLYGDVWIEDLLTNLPGGKLGFLVLANLAIFILGFFIDFFEIAFIILPLLVPAAQLLGIDLVWFGVVIAMNLQTSFLTPPFGFSLFYLRGVAPKEVKTSAIYRGVLPFIAIQLVALILVLLFPQLVTALL